MRLTAYKIVELLQKKGFIAYWAGGCVRDILLEIRPKDYDIATNATPEQIEEIFEKTVPIGKSFGVILVVEEGHHFEIATFRKEGEYADGRRPTHVNYAEPAVDAERRDFTINGLFYDPMNDQVIDYVDGQRDLEAKLIRFIGNPEERIKEDHLRIIRAVRMKNMLDFQYHPDTYKAIKKHAKLIEKVAAERLGDEMNKIISGKNIRQAFEDMEDTGILEVIMPEIVKLKGLAQPRQYHQEGDVWEHTMRSVQSLPEDTTLEVRWATLMHDIGKYDTFKVAERIRYDGHAKRSAEIAEEILRRFKSPRRLIEHVQWIVEHHMTMVPLVEMPLARRRKWFLNESFLHLLEVFRADAMGTTPTDLSLYNQIVELYRNDLKTMPVRPKQLLNGKDVMAILGIPPGQKVGEILEKVSELQLAGELKTKEEAEKWLICAISKI